MGTPGCGLAFCIALVGFANLAWVGLAEGAPDGLTKEGFLVSHKTFLDLKPKGEGVGGGGERRSKREATSSDLTAEEIFDYLQKHRKLRSQTVPEAASMKYMTWDDSLATMAQQWSDMCIWDHGMPENISPFTSLGQNLYLTSRGTPTKRINGTGVVQAWFNEDRFYTFETQACQSGKMCGHYTQVVWDTSFAVGCAQAYCPTAQETNTANVIIVTCNYGPAGNSNRQPFTAGSPCTQCASGVGLCLQNQCSNCTLGEDGCECKQICQNCGTLDETTCTCSCPNGFMRNDCGALCADTDDNCGKNPGWPSPSLCTQYDYVMRKCPLMCGRCVKEIDSEYTCDEPDPHPTTGDRPTPGLTTVQPTAACRSLTCANGGSVVTASCECRCTAEYQGKTCQHSRKQARSGVKVGLRANIARWNTIRPYLLRFTAKYLTTVCNFWWFKRCCPNSGTKTTPDRLAYVEESHVEVATGYPEPHPKKLGVFVVMVLVIPPVPTELCLQGGSLAPSSRRRRDTYEWTPLRHKRAADDGSYLDQDLLLEALQENMENLTTELQAATSLEVEVDSVEAGQEEEVTQAPPPAGLSPGAIAAIVIVVVILVAVVAVASVLLYKKSATKAKVDPGKGCDEK